MKKLKNKNGITLVALIITIIVLLILAVIAINAVQDGGIILAHAKNAQQTYKNEAQKEQELLSYYSEYLDAQGDIGPWKISQDNQNEIIKINEDGTSTKLEIGDKVNYKPEIGKKYLSKVEKTGAKTNGDQIFTTADTENDWRVLGIENGKILLVSAKTVFPNSRKVYELDGKDAYNNVIKELNNISAIYGTGKGSEYARSINSEDLFNIANITDKIREWKSNSSNAISENNVTYNYRWNSVEEQVEFKRENSTEWILSTCDEMNFEDGTIINKDNPNKTKTITSNYYVLENTLSSYIKNEKIKNVIFPIEVGNGYMCATRLLQIWEQYNFNEKYNGKGDIYYSIPLVSKELYDKYKNYMMNITLYYANKRGSMNGQTSTLSHNVGVKPVVVLKSNVKLTLDNGVYNIEY